jgi:hypothetical protein
MKEKKRSRYSTRNNHCRNLRGRKKVANYCKCQPLITSDLWLPFRIHIHSSVTLLFRSSPSCGHVRGSPPPYMYTIQYVGRYSPAHSFLPWQLAPQRALRESKQHAYTRRFTDECPPISEQTPHHPSIIGHGTVRCYIT